MVHRLAADKGFSVPLLKQTSDPVGKQTEEILSDAIAEQPAWAFVIIFRKYVGIHWSNVCSASS